ncbi:ArsR/SmtB family transcription factor [Thalassobacillus devorans]|uniref:ArsR/SmtB family transcription factor n=1 Tax=Thalassobacillus devorans TaxID=279813 RepID=UPI00048F66DE|nr:metalloregulator ArsR/SmtB family transcription factor [Thalassobacillus devorans]
MMAATARHDVYQAIADPTRRQILKQLAEKDASIKEIADTYSQSRTAIVKHLQVLQEAQLVRDRKEGRAKIYSLQPAQLMEVKEWVSFFEQYWDNKLGNLKNLVEEE